MKTITMVNKIPPISANKLYLGNLPKETTESNLRQLFSEHNLSYTNILLKPDGYAFVECADQSAADKIIDKLQCFNFNGSQLVVEPTFSTTGKRTGMPFVPEGKWTRKFR
ncbi:unnamed protein product [Ceutorhynchus assimilis]|uniref:RRM domain-containing protein n=1 Tax=Ceutorhynchus assimilis TaxID=467358 RepID=A0A9N9MTI9_9CUCU|nr:unnamed protein product [Ceutorhynchus assimilis]